MSQDPADQEKDEKPHEPDERREGWFPRPPRIESAADFIVIVFACTVAFILIALTVATVAAAFTGTDIKPYFAILTSVMTSLISALVGYLAGSANKKGKGPEPQP